MVILDTMSSAQTKLYPIRQVALDKKCHPNMEGQWEGVRNNNNNNHYYNSNNKHSNDNNNDNTIYNSNSNNNKHSNDNNSNSNSNYQTTGAGN